MRTPPRILAVDDVPNNLEIVRIRLEEFSAGRILPHERTFPAAKQDRLELLTALNTNVSPVFGLYAGAHPALASLTALTPVDDGITEVNHCIYWRAPWLSVLKPVLRPYVRAFLRQDRDIMERQQQGLRGAPLLALIDDSDTQARWYYRLKEEYRRARAEDRPFANPVKPRTLRWRS